MTNNEKMKECNIIKKSAEKWQMKNNDVNAEECIIIMQSSAEELKMQNNSENAE